MLTVDQPRKETLYLYKNTWGYVRMEIEVQGDFLEVEKKVVTSEDFIGSVYGVEYIYPSGENRKRPPLRQNYGASGKTGASL